MLLNALAVPILSLSTIMALYVIDRRVDWLWRLRPLIGVPLMVAIAAPWLLIRAHFDGVPFSGLTWGEFIRAARRRAGHEVEGGAAHLHARLHPRLPARCAAAGAGAAKPVARARRALQRFLFAWIVGYWLYLELIASKPALYTVQAMFPAAAAAVALALDRDGTLAIPPRMLRLPGGSCCREPSRCSPSS